MPHDLYAALPIAIFIADRGCLKNRKRRLFAQCGRISALEIIDRRQPVLRFPPWNHLALYKNPPFSLFSNKP